MKKSVYSLVLMDSLINEVDRLAYANGTSRSNMVNRILADYLSLTTPEMRIQDIFSSMEGLIAACRDLQTTVNPSERAFSIKSMLSYKYNPTVRYNLVLYPTVSDTFGELRVVFRTQNVNLLNMVTSFFILWVKLEEAYNPDNMPAYKIEDGKLTRRLSTIEGATHENLGAATVSYVELFDKALKTYFEYRADPIIAANRVELLYRNYLKTNPRRV
ncbi:MAG: hypothetical protein IKU84_03380 [Clostridia bacterium]|nr:hypothetical protein [Clostridia bacterium]